MEKFNRFLFHNLSVNEELAETSDILNRATGYVKNSLQQFAYTADFTTDLQLAFGKDINTDLLGQSWQVGQFALPEIEIVNHTEIGNALGAFARDTNKIYLNEEFLIANENSPDIIDNVLIEEYGHFIDSYLNNNDAPGDEGAIFAALVQGELSDRELQQLRNEDDTATVILDGKTVEIEQSFTSLNNGLGGNAGFGENVIPRHDDSLPEPEVEEPAAESPTTEEPEVEEPAAESPTTEEPEVEEPAAESPTTEEPEADKPTFQEPEVEEPTTEEPTASTVNSIFAVDVTSVFEEGIKFYDQTYDRFYVNNNGNITFDRPLATFTPDNISSYPIIAPFFADVDTRENNIQASPGGNSQGTNLVYYNLNPDAGEITITWDDVGKFPNETTPNAFQLILRDSQEEDRDYEIEFRYEEIQWTVGGASEDVYARVGFSNGDGQNFYELPFSNNQEQLLQLEAGSNVREPGKFVFPVRNGRPEEFEKQDYTLLPTTTVHRFYEHQKDFHLYSADEREVEVIKGRSSAGRQGYEYEYEGEKFRVLFDNTDELSGDIIEGAKPVYKYLNTDTGSYLYTIDDVEIDYIEDHLTNYKRAIPEDLNGDRNENEIDMIEGQFNSSDSITDGNQNGIAFYAFESEDAAKGATLLPTIPVYRILNHHSGTHFLTTSEDVAMNLESNYSHFSMENNREPVFHVFEL